MKKLYRSMQDKMIGGVLGGFADYISADPTIVRLLYVLLTLLVPIPLIVFYFIAWIVIPKNIIPTDSEVQEEKISDSKSQKDTSENSENNIEQKI